MYNERKLKYKNGAIKQFLIIMLFAVMSVVHTDKISAETSSVNAAAEVKKSVTEYLPVGQNKENTTVGRYALNYTGNINVYSSPSSRNDDISYAVRYCQDGLIVLWGHFAEITILPKW